MAGPVGPWRSGDPDRRPCRPADATVRRLRRDDRDGDSSTYEKQLPVDDLDLAGSDRGGKRRRSQGGAAGESRADRRSEEHTSELQSLMRISYAVFCLKKKNNKQ